MARRSPEYKRKVAALEVLRDGKMQIEIVRFPYLPRMIYQEIT